MPAITRLLVVVSSIIFFIFFCALLLFVRLALCPPRSLLSDPLPCSAGGATNEAESPTTVRNLVFGLASSARSFPNRRRYIQSWWDPSRLRGFLFLDSPITDSITDPVHLPQIRISEDVSKIPYSFPFGQRSAIRVARVAKELVEAVAEMAEVRWLVLGDDDTVFFPDNLATSLRKHDWKEWRYVGSSSEAVDQNEKFSFDMAFGGGGFALSLPLARVLARVLDSCLVRYSHLYGSDEKIFSCLSEPGVGLTRDPGFHQVDLRGDIFGMLTAHPLTPLLSLHHLDSIGSIFPNIERVQALEHLFKAVKVDPGRILQQTVCYNPLTFQTVSISWGYAIQIFDGIRLLPEVLSWQKTFMPWRRGRASYSSRYMFNTREFPRDPCARPQIFFFEGMDFAMDGSLSTYIVHDGGICIGNGTSLLNLKRVKVFSRFLSLESSSQLGARRRQCCDILPSLSADVMSIKIRECGEELIAFLPTIKS